MKRSLKVLLILLVLFIISGCKDKEISYQLNSVHTVNGRQGITTDGEYYWVSGSTTLTKYDKNWNIIKENKNPFIGYSKEVNHIGDIDIYNNELYLGVEYFMDGIGKNIQVAVYDADTLELKRVFPFREDTGQLECSGIGVDENSGYVYMVSWIDDESSNYLYRYSLKNENYVDKIKMDNPPKWIQGITSYNGSIYVTSDDGDADKNEPDNLYKIDIKENIGKVSLAYTFDDVIRQGEIEGLSYDSKNKKFYLLYNRGARIILGMPKCFYDGYEEEIHEVFEYDIK